MLVKSKLMLVVGVMFAAASFAACGSAGGTSNSGGNAGGRCTPGETQSCACLGGTTGVQLCADDGAHYETCQCETTTTTSGSGGSSSSSSGAMATCGDGVIQASDHCDNPGSEFHCKVDCALNVGGSGGGTTTTTTETGSGGACAGHVYYAGKFDGASSVWGGLTQAMGATGLDAGNNVCKSLNVGADHVCDYEEVLLAQAQGELANVPAGTTAWVQRTTVAMVNGNPSQPGPGGRCNGWTYLTNHISDGEYATFDTVGNPTFHLDNDTTFDPAQPGMYTLADLQCGGVTRSILCCYQACN